MLYGHSGYDLLHSEDAQRVLKVLKCPIQAFKPQGLCLAHIKYIMGLLIFMFLANLYIQNSSVILSLANKQ